MTGSDDIPVAGTVVLLRPAASTFEVLMMQRPGRGSFAGAWAFPGGKVEQVDRMPGASEREDARRAGIRETKEEVGLVVDGLVVLSQWTPPAQAPTRIRTWFFLAEAPRGDVSTAADEVADYAWVTPASGLAQHAAGEWELYPPTWITLYQLAAFADAGSALAAAGTAELFSTRVLELPTGRAFEWEQGRLDAATLPWRFLPA